MILFVISSGKKKVAVAGQSSPTTQQSRPPGLYWGAENPFVPPIGRGGKDGGSRAKVGQVLRVIKSNCPRTVAAIDEAAGTRCLPLALPDQVGNFHLAPLEVRQDEAWGQGRGERKKR